MRKTFALLALLAVCVLSGCRCPSCAPRKSSTEFGVGIGAGIKVQSTTVQPQR